MPRPVLTVVEGGKRTGRAWLHTLYSTYGGAVMSRCRYLLNNPTAAEDAMHDVFAKAVANERQFRSEASPLTWLMKIATHHCLNLLRSDRARWRDAYQHLQVVCGEGHDGARALEARDTIRRALERFDEETQSAVVHYYVDDLTLEEVAVLLERSVPTIRKRLREFAAHTSLAPRDDVGATS